MSTQRRENRWQRTGCTACAEASGGPGDRFLLQGWKALGHASPSLGTRPDRTNASGGTAPPVALARLATNSLQSDHFIEQLVRQDIRRGLPPPGAGSRAVTSVPATRRSSLSPISIPPGFSSFHPASPQAPAGNPRWAERYDGKRDLHFQHAA